MICYLYPEPTYLFFAPDLPGLLYYSHLPAMTIALLVGLFVYLNAKHLLLNRLLLLLAVSFSIWTSLSLMVWGGNDGELFMFIWPFFAIMQGLIAILSIYFAYVYLTKKDVSNKTKLLFIALLSPVLLFAHTDLSVSGFNLAWCDAFEYEGTLYKTYNTTLGILSVIWVAFLHIKHYLLAERQIKKQILIMGLGIELFLLLFFTIIPYVSNLTAEGVLTDSRLEFYGLFGMTFFMIVMSVMIVQFKTFKVGVAASQALVIALVILVASQFTFVTTTTSIILTAVTLLFVGPIGIMLIRSVKREIKHRVEIEQLATKLEKANVRLKALDKQKSEFVSIASHQLRSPITAIRGYASLLIDGSYGVISKKAQDPLKRISESAKNMAFSIEDYLNVSRIESGNMKYNLSDFNLPDKVDYLVDNFRAQAVKEKLTLLFRTDLKSKGIINADEGKVIQIVQNLLNNSIKYTEQGSIKILVRDDVVGKKIYIDIIDTGIGMSEKTIQILFQKFERADNANSVNVSGTGLGLFVAHKMAVAMGGDITAHSEGDGKGSRFTVELPLAM